MLATLILIHWFYQPYYNWKYSKYIGFVNWVNFTYCVSFCRIFMQRVSISSILLFTTFRFIHALVPWQNLEGIVFSKSPRRAILYDRKKNSQHRHCHAVFNHHSRHSKFANTGYTTGWRFRVWIPNNIPFANTEPCSVLLRGANVYGYGNSCHAATPAALQSELSYADWLNCCDKGWILVHPEKTWSGQDFVRPLAKGEKPLSSLHWNPTKTPKN